MRDPTDRAAGVEGRAVSEIGELIVTEYGPMIVAIFDFNQTRALRETHRGVHHDRMALLTGLLDAMPSDRVVVDAGANLGAFAIPLAAHVGTGGRVHAFEPQPMIHNMLAGSMALSVHWAQLRAYNVCLGAEDGRIKVPQYDYGRYMNFGSVEFGERQVEALDQERGCDPAKVECVDLRQLDGYGFQRLDLLKIDVQRMEIPLLAGAAETLRRCRPVLFIEWIDHEPEVLREALAGHGYRVAREVGDDWLCYPVD